MLCEWTEGEPRSTAVTSVRSLVRGDRQVDADRQCRGVLRSLTTEDGRPWVRQSKSVDRRFILVDEIDTPDDRAKFLELEGNFHLGRGEPSEAVPYFRELADLRPESWEATAGLGVAYVRSGQYREAIGPLERALSQPRREVSMTVVAHPLAMSRISWRSAGVRTPANGLDCRSRDAVSDGDRNSSTTSRSVARSSRSRHSTRAGEGRSASHRARLSRAIATSSGRASSFDATASWSARLRRSIQACDLTSAV